MIQMIERLFDVNRHSSLLSVYLTRKRPNFRMFSSHMSRFVSVSFLLLHICTIWADRLVTAGQQQLQQTAAGRIVLASVVDGRNRPLVAVGPDDFVVTENGQARDVLDVHVADYPVVVVVDDTGAEPERLSAMKAAVRSEERRVGKGGRDWWSA